MDNSLMTHERRVVMIDRMGRKKTSGLHKTPRQAVQIPVTWVQLARKIAVKRQQPMMWYLVSLIADAASKEGLELPKPPWDEDFIIDEPKKKKD